MVRLHGFPASNVTDKDRIFLSAFWKELFRIQGTTLKHSTTYHPQTDGQTEIVNKGLETYLRCFISGQPRSWALWYPHFATKFSPFKCCMGKTFPMFCVWAVATHLWIVLKNFYKVVIECLDDLRFNLLRAQQKMKTSVHSKRSEECFDVGDMVYLKLQPYRQCSLAKRPFEKLAARFYGPFPIIQKVGKVAYTLQLPPTSKIHLIFHVCQLCRVVDDVPVSPTIHDLLTPDLELAVEPEELLDVRQVKQ